MAESAPPRDQHAPAARLGAELRAARHNLGWELPQLAASLRIRQSYLEALEAGRIAELPGTTYALGFVRAYASALGLPGEEMARRFRADAEGIVGRPALHFPAPVPRRGVPAGAVMLLGVVILAGAYGGWWYLTEHRATQAQTVPPIPDRLQPQAARPTPSPQVATILPGTAPPAPRPPAPQDVVSQPAVPQSALAQPAPSHSAPSQSAPPAANAPATAPATSASGTAPPPAQKLPGSPQGASVPGTAQAPALSPAGTQTQAPGTPAPTPAPAGTRLVLTASADAWFTVKQPGGPALLNKMMHAGDSWPVPADKTGLTLTTGNAGATAITVDGAPMPGTLGTPGMVRRDIPLDADLLKSGQLPPPKARAPHKQAQPPPA